MISWYLRYVRLRGALSKLGIWAIAEGEPLFFSCGGRRLRDEKTSVRLQTWLCHTQLHPEFLFSPERASVMVCFESIWFHENKRWKLRLGYGLLQAGRVWTSFLFFDPWDVGRSEIDTHLRTVEHTCKLSRNSRWVSQQLISTNCEANY